ncbi:unnamed protein product [Gordionus sp. m RMFG-2023]
MQHLLDHTKRSQGTNKKITNVRDRFINLLKDNYFRSLWRNILVKANSKQVSVAPSEIKKPITTDRISEMNNNQEESESIQIPPNSPTFINKMSFEISIYLLNPQTKKEMKYTILKPGESYNTPFPQDFFDWVIRKSLTKQKIGADIFFAD